MIKRRKHAHIGLGTNDIDKTTNWYIDELGFELYGQCVAPDGTPCRFIRNGDVQYEIFQPVNGIKPEHVGKIDHFAFVSDDIEKDYEFCMNKGYTFTTDGIQEIPGAWEKGTKYFKIASATGEEIEFAQIL